MHLPTLTIFNLFLFFKRLVFYALNDSTYNFLPETIILEVIAF